MITRLPEVLRRHPHPAAARGGPPHARARIFGLRVTRTHPLPPIFRRVAQLQAALGSSEIKEKEAVAAVVAEREK